MGRREQIPMIDLRTDFVGRPVPAMVEAMVEAAGRQPGFLPRGDPTVARLERVGAELLGKEDALFCPTCTMANQIAVYLACRAGDAVVAEATSHMLTIELASMGALSGAVPLGVPGSLGVMNMAALDAALEGHQARARIGLVAMENSHVMSGGRVVPLAAMETVRQKAAFRQIPVHLDGARLFNAAAFLRVDARTLAATADTVAISLNKGLCAPMGALLAGSRAMIAEAARVRQMFGGDWRPANITAAAAIVALESMVDRIAEDNARAAELACGLAGLSIVTVDPAAVETNIIFAKLDPRSAVMDEIVRELAQLNVLVLPFGQDTIRLCLHREIDSTAVETVVRAFQNLESRTFPAGRTKPD